MHYPPEKRFVDAIDGIDGWLWPEKDLELFAGIACDWMYSHNKHYFDWIQKYEVCIQAGGACGMYPKLLAQRFKTVYTFEPYHENFYFLTKNCSDDNIIKINAALGSEVGFVSMEKEDKSNQGQFEVSKTKPGIVPVMKIDNFNFPVVDFIQLDVEGYDLEAIKGGIKTIKRCKPTISIEIPLAFPDNLFYTMHELGYVVMAKSMSDLVFVHKSNIEALKRSKNTQSVEKTNEL